MGGLLWGSRRKILFIFPSMQGAGRGPLSLLIPPQAMLLQHRALSKQIFLRDDKKMNEINK
jgi:hypothetical protein